jgi:hypothetical protein
MEGALATFDEDAREALIFFIDYTKFCLAQNEWGSEKAEDEDDDGSTGSNAVDEAVGAGAGASAACGGGGASAPQTTLSHQSPASRQPLHVPHQPQQSPQHAVKIKVERPSVPGSSGLPLQLQPELFRCQEGVLRSIRFVGVHAACTVDETGLVVHKTPGHLESSRQANAFPPLPMEQHSEVVAQTSPLPANGVLSFKLSTPNRNRFHGFS